MRVLNRVFSDTVESKGQGKVNPTVDRKQTEAPGAVLTELTVSMSATAINNRHCK